MTATNGGTAPSRPPNRSNPGSAGNKGHVALIDCDRLAAWLGVEVVFVRRLVAEHRIPFLKIGKFVRFDPEEIAGWIDTQRVRPVHRSSRTRTRTRG